MEAVILAGGFGTRMRPLTYTRPKPLLPLLNRPLLAHIIDQMPKRVDKIVLPVGYLREQIDAYFQEHPDPRVVLVEELEPLGTGGAIKNCEKHLTGPFFVYNGDIVSSLGLEEMWQHHQAKRAKISISLWPVDEPWHFGVVEHEPDLRIRRFVEKPPKGKEPSNLINAGHYLLDHEVLDLIPRGRMFSIERELYEDWAREGKSIFGFRFPGHWIDCGRPTSLLEAHATVLRERGQTSLIDPTARVARDARLDGYAIGENAQVGHGCRIARSILMDDVRLGKGVTVLDSILGEGVEVEDGTTLENVVAGDFAMIEGGRHIKDQKIGMRVEHLEAR